MFAAIGSNSLPKFIRMHHAAGKAVGTTGFEHCQAVNESDGNKR